MAIVDLQAPVTPPADEAQSSTDSIIDPALAFMRAGGATAQQLVETRLQLARGTVFEASITAVEQSDTGAQGLMLCLDEVAQAVAGRKSLKPLKAAFAQIRAEAKSVVGRPGHYSWCVKCIPSPDAAPNSGKTDHAGATTPLRTPDGMSFEGETHILSAGLTRNEGFSDDIGTEIVLDCGGNVLFFDAETAPAMLASLKAFTAQFAAMIAQLPAERQS